MRKIGSLLIAILVIIIMTLSTVVSAYEGDNLDPENKIEMPGSLSNGNGTVTVSDIEGEMQYQFIEIEQSKYEAIKKYKDQIELMQAYIKGEQSSWADSQAKSEYEALAQKYEATYNERISEVYSKYGNVDDNSISKVKESWKSELQDYDNNKWKNASNNKIKVNITKFSETKYFIAWVKIGEIYDAEIYAIEGVGNAKTSNNSDEDTSESKDTTASTTGQALPKTGTGSTILGLISMSGISAGYSFRKYRKIK